MKPWKDWPAGAVAVVCYRASADPRVNRRSTERRPCWHCGQTVALSPATLRSVPVPHEFLCWECTAEHERQRGRPLKILPRTPAQLAEHFAALVEDSP